MRDFRALFLPASVAVALVVAGSAHADVSPERKSTLTLATPLEVPGATLEPGTYVVKLVDTQSNRNVVTFMSADERKTFATAIATPHVASNDPRNSTFVFYATPEGAMRALRTWYAPGDRYGQDFLYAPERAAALRQAVKSDVPALTADQTVELSNRVSAPVPAAPAVVTTDAELVPMAAAPAKDSVLAAPAPARAPAAMVADASQASPASPAPPALPATASHTPLLVACGFAALALAGTLRFSGRG